MNIDTNEMLPDTADFQIYRFHFRCKNEQFLKYPIQNSNTQLTMNMIITTSPNGTAALC